MMALMRCMLALACWLLPATAMCLQKQVFYATLAGANESPPVVSPGTGYSLLFYAPKDGSLRVLAAFSGLTSGDVAAHVHCCVVPPGTTAPVATMTPYFTGFPISVTSGSYDHTFDMSDPASWNATYLTAHTNVIGAINAMVEGMADGTAYFNIHTTNFPGGEIRGNLYLDSLLIDGFE